MAYRDIKSVEDAYAALKLKQEDEKPFSNPKNSRQEAVNSFMDAIVITEAVNEGWVPDYDTYDEKYEVWWNMRSKAAGGPGFSYDDCNCVSSDSGVGARLVFRNRSVAKYAANQFPHVFEPFMTFKEFTGVSKE